jgi:mRNA degradation ribonuclease J1/J2
LGGSASIAELDAAVIDREQFSPEAQSVVHGDGPSTEIQYRLAWARTYLKGMGLLMNSQRGVWSITELGQGVKEDQIAQLHAEFVAITRKKGRTDDVGDATLGERLTLSSGFVAVTVVVHRGTGRAAAPAHLHSRGFSEDPKALEPVALKVEEELEVLASDNITDVTRIAQAVRRTVGKWVGETYRRQPMIVPTVIEI